MLYVVDNASEPPLQSAMKRIISERANSKFIEMKENLGLGVAINRGANQAIKDGGADFLLLLDQDTEPGSGGIKQLMSAYEKLSTYGKPICIGPSVVDVSTGLPHGFHRARWFFWLRINSDQKAREKIQCDSLNGSGSLCGLRDFLSLGGVDEELFIDHIDTEWSFRAKSAGWDIYGIPQVRFLHRMGEHSFRFWFFGWRVWPYRNPERHHYLFRNTVRLMKRSYVPCVWKVWAIVKLWLTAFVHLLFDPARGAQLKAMLRGVKSELLPVGDRKID